MTAHDVVKTMPTPLAGMLARHRRRIDRAVSAMRAQGREPAPTHDQWGTTCPVLGFSLRWADDGGDTAEVRISAEGERGRLPIWGASWPERGDRVSGQDLLACLVEAWPALAAHFASEPSQAGRVSDPATIDLRAGIGRPDLGRFSIVAHGASIAVECDAGSGEFGAEGAIVVETLMALGDLCSRRMETLGDRRDLVEAWRRATSGTELLPAILDVSPEGVDPPDDTDRKTAFWSRRMGQDVTLYRRAATWCEARQRLASAGLCPEPTAADRDPTRLPDGLPDQDDVEALAAEADNLATLEGHDLSSCMNDGLRERNDTARQVDLYRSWPRRHEPGMMS